MVPHNPLDFRTFFRIFQERPSIHGPNNKLDKPPFQGTRLVSPGLQKLLPPHLEKRHDKTSTARELRLGMWEGIGSSRSGD